MKKTKEEIQDEAKPSVPELTPKQLFEQYIDQLNQERHVAGEAHARHERQHPSRFGDSGSIDIYAISMKIEGAVNLAQRLGLVEPDVDPTDFLK